MQARLTAEGRAPIVAAYGGPRPRRGAERGRLRRARRRGAHPPDRRGAGRMTAPAYDPDSAAARLRPLRPASRRRLVAAMGDGPVLWLVALIVVAWLVEHRDAIELAAA